MGKLFFNGLQENCPFPCRQDAQLSHGVLCEFNMVSHSIPSMSEGLGLGQSCLANFLELFSGAEPNITNKIIGWKKLRQKDLQSSRRMANLAGFRNSCIPPTESH